MFARPIRSEASKRTGHVNLPRSLPHNIIFILYQCRIYYLGSYSKRECIILFMFEYQIVLVTKSVNLRVNRQDFF